MDTNSKLYQDLNKAWKSTCKIVLGEEVGELKDYEEWLKEYYPQSNPKKSHMSGGDVIFAKPDYCDTADFISLDEVTEKAADPLTINEIKDIDSVLEAISGKWEYTGNKILGNSKFVEASDNVIDSQYVMNSANVKQSSYIYQSYFVSEGSKYIFGSNWVAKNEFLIKSGGYNLKRCFEINWCDNGGDMYFCFYCLSCSDLMFSFNQKNKRHLIGNLQLQKDKYRALKEKLVGEMREELKRDKKFYSLFKFVPNEKPPSNIKLSLAPERKATNIAPMQSAFSSTFKVLFKKDPGSIDEYENWLGKYMPPLVEVVSPFGLKTLREYMTPDIWVLPEKRIVTQRESVELADLHLKEEDVESIEKIKGAITGIGFFISDVSEKSMNTIGGLVAYHAANMYKVVDGNYSEHCGVCGSLLNSKYAFGCNKLNDSRFNINCYNSFNLNRCFELDMSSNCADTYFAHNCEGLHEAMFCFNAKGKRYAIGNTQLPPEQYRKIKDTLVEQMANEIIQTKGMKYDIFNIGCAGRE